MKDNNNFVKAVSELYEQIKNTNWSYSVSLIINSVLFISLTSILLKYNLLNWYSLIFYIFLFIGCTSFFYHLENLCCKCLKDNCKKNKVISELKNLPDKEQFILEKFVRRNCTTIKFESKEELSYLRILKRKLGFISILEKDKKVTISAENLKLLKKYLKLIHRPNTVTIKSR